MKFIKEKNTVIFENLQDYDLAATFNCGQCFRWDATADGWQGFAGEYPCFIHFVENDLQVQCLVPVDDMQAFADYMLH